jgi:NAD(P)-dependent dehydrogenase (short-subunit alcohol dehydrogenase family)
MAKHGLKQGRMDIPESASEVTSHRFKGKVALVTGGATGIGLAVAERIIAEGGRVVIGDIDSAELEGQAERLGGACAAVVCDARSEEGTIALAELALERFGGLDIAVANAGGGISSPIVDLELGAWQQVLNLTLTGVFLTIKAAARVMSDGGSIVAMSSLNAVQPARGMSAYCAAKAGVESLVNVAALELGARNIRVNAVAPGLVRTGTTEPLWGIRRMVEAYTANTAIGRYGRPSDIAAAVAFLASDDAAYMSGTTVLVDGGAHHLAYPDTRSIRAAADTGR